MNPPPSDEPSIWELIREDLRDLKAGQDAARKEIANLRVDVGVLKWKAGIWGTIAGAIPAGIALLWHYVSGRSK